MIPLILHIALVALCGLHILLRQYREPESRLAWLVVLVALPYVGALGYLLLGTTNIGRKRVARLRDMTRLLPPPGVAPCSDAPASATGDADSYEGVFRVGHSISGYDAVGGNSAELMADSDSAIAMMVDDIDRASETVHLLFYIWLDDHNGTKMAEALRRAAARGITCRAMVDDIGSHAFIRSALWDQLTSSGVKLIRALKVGNPLIRLLNGRIDLRDHRKILVVDNRVTYCGSQNCADPAFLPKARFAPWVDVVMRLEGPVVRQNQHLFAVAWMGNGGDDISALVRQKTPPARGGFTAQVVATGPTYRHSAMPEMFATLIYAARRELLVTTPYYVPTPAIQAALCAAASRGVETTIIFPARNDDLAVGAASRSHYQSLLAAGVRLFEFQSGLLHTKSLTLDGEITLIGSANMDRRSFDLNYENNILLQDRQATAAMRERQARYLAQSREVTAAEVAAWGIGRRLWNNTLAIMSPLL
ncbi:MAG: cardiolipin synthase [Pseudomonadota bacterium]